MIVVCINGPFIIIIIMILGCYMVLSLILAESALHSISPARIASLGKW